MAIENNAGMHDDLNLKKNQTGTRLEHDAVHIFNKFDAISYQENLEVRSAFDYEDDIAEDNSSKSDGEVQSTKKWKRNKQAPPLSVLMRSSAKQGAATKKL